MSLSQREKFACNSSRAKLSRFYIESQKKPSLTSTEIKAGNSRVRLEKLMNVLGPPAGYASLATGTTS